jgi:hypothetical protein
VRKLLALALLVLAGTLPADADILTQQQLETMVRAQPDLSMKLIGGRQYVSVKGDGDGLGYIDAATIDYGYQVDRTDVLIVPLWSGGSGGVFTTLVFTTYKGVQHYVGRIDSQGHLDVHLSAGMIAAVTPVYGPRDPQSHPSGYRTARYAIHDGRLLHLRE